MTGPAMTGPAPLDDAAFAALLEPFGPFEPAPLLVAAVSGGADSMALALLAAAWAGRRGGEAVALTVDHRLRPESGAEAAAVGKALRERGIRHEILTLGVDLPVSGVENAARAARYRVLVERCRSLGALRLLTAHHADDQAETLLLRLSRGSGPDGLAGMAAWRNLEDVVLLRPFLSVAPDRLRATCGAAGLAWFDDPTNAGDGNARGRLRRVGSLLAAEGLTAQSLARTADRAAAQRRLLDRLTADLLGRAVALSPWGFAELDPPPFAAADPALAGRALARVLATVAGEAHPPRWEALNRMASRVAAGEGGTLAGCVLRRGSGGRIMVCREAAAIAPPLPLAPGGRGLWDGRFVVELSADSPAGLRVEARGRLTGGGDERPAGVPAAAWAACPALDSRPGEGGAWLRFRFAPRQALAGAMFPVVSRGGDII